MPHELFTCCQDSNGAFVSSVIPPASQCMTWDSLGVERIGGQREGRREGGEEGGREGKREGGEEGGRGGGREGGEEGGREGREKGQEEENTPEVSILYEIKGGMFIVIWNEHPKTCQYNLCLLQFLSRHRSAETQCWMRRYVVRTYVRTSLFAMRPRKCSNLLYTLSRSQKVIMGFAWLLMNPLTKTVAM